MCNESCTSPAPALLWQACSGGILYKKKYFLIFWLAVWILWILWIRLKKAKQKYYFLSFKASRSSEEINLRVLINNFIKTKLGITINFSFLCTSYVIKPLILGQVYLYFNNLRTEPWAARNIFLFMVIYYPHCSVTLCVLSTCFLRLSNSFLKKLPWNIYLILTLAWQYEVLCHHTILKVYLKLFYHRQAPDEKKESDK